MFGPCSRYTPVVDGPGCSCLFQVVCNVWSKGIYCSSEVVVSAPNNVPVVHEMFKVPVDCHKRSTEESSAEVSKGFIAHVLSST